jgi:hypothetical protein
MFDIRDFSNTALALIVIMVLASVVTVHALTVPGAKKVEFEFESVMQLTIDPTMTFSMLPEDVHVGVGDTFIVTFAIGNVKDMYAWQVFVRYDPAMLECLGASLSSDYVLSSKVTVSGALTSYDSAEFPPGPLQRVDNVEGWILAGDCLLGADQPTFYGSGGLCHIKFKAISSGSSRLALLQDITEDFVTFTLNFDLEHITSSSSYFSNVYAAPK